MHAKTVIVDSRYIFISSANFTEAAHLRNIEVGVTFDSIALAHHIAKFFDVLLAAKQLLPIMIH